MTRTELDVAISISQIFYLFSFIISFYASRNFFLPSYLKRFYWYPLIGLIVIIFFWLNFFKITPLYFYYYLNRFSLLFHYTFLAFFIFKVLNNHDFFNLEKILFIVFFIILLCVQVYDYINSTYNSFFLTNTFLVIFCINFYYKLLNTTPVIALKEEPFFWIISGVFLGMGITIPFYAFQQYLFQFISNSLFYLLILIAGVGYSLMHIFFIKAFLCKTLQRKEL